MKYKEAKNLADKYNKSDGLYAEVVRILPSSVDEARAGDNGWDVKVTNLTANDDIYPTKPS